MKESRSTGIILLRPEAVPHKWYHHSQYSRPSHNYEPNLILLAWLMEEVTYLSMLLTFLLTCRQGRAETETLMKWDNVPINHDSIWQALVISMLTYYMLKYPLKCAAVRAHLLSECNYIRKMFYSIWWLIDWLIDWIEFVVMPAQYQLCEVHMLWTWDRP